MEVCVLQIQVRGWGTKSLRLLNEQSPSRGQRSTRSSKAKGSEPRGGSWVVSPCPEQGGRTEGSGMELHLGFPLPQAAQGMPQSTAHSRAGQAPGQPPAQGRIRAGSSSQPPSPGYFHLFFLSPSNLFPSSFPLRAISSPGSEEVLGQQLLAPHTTNHKPSSTPEQTALSSQHDQPAPGNHLSTHTLGLKHRVRDRSVRDISLSLIWESLLSPSPCFPSQR